MKTKSSMTSIFTTLAFLIFGLNPVSTNAAPIMNVHVTSGSDIDLTFMYDFSIGTNIFEVT